ncbi:hypothetical protein QW131_17130 [Roseibium salinum]|nr:hypothetical protein [Roseibium salinum]
MVAVLEAAGVTSMLNRLTGSVTALFKDEDDSLTIVAVYSEDGQQSNFLRGRGDGGQSCQRERSGCARPEAEPEDHIGARLSGGSRPRDGCRGHAETVGPDRQDKKTCSPWSVTNGRTPR